MNAQTDHIPLEDQAEPGTFRLIATLGFAGFISGLILVSAYLFTKPLIEQNKADALERAIFKVLPGTTSFKILALNDGQLKETTSLKGDVIFLGLNDVKEQTGLAIFGRETGFQDFVGIIYGYDPVNKLIIGYEVLECKETPGLGDKIFKDAAFLTNFKALSIAPEIILVKKGEKKQTNEVDAITGATITSRTVVKILNNSIKKWEQAIEDYIHSTPAKN
jgi:electron transport complex protein RnfG